MFISINTSSGLPLYRQIVDQVKVGIATRTIPVGEKLPSVRALSAMLEINPTTVQRAYLDLEREGLIESRRGQGSFVTGDGVRLAASERVRQLREHLANALAEARRLRVPRHELMRVFEEEMRRCFDPAPGEEES